MPPFEQVYYEGTYNSHFRPLSYEPIITVEISPTGSGKTYFYKNAHHTIMLMPTNALVRQNGGMIAATKAQQGERSSWEELQTHRCEYMTYDKFAGHMMREDLSEFNIIIDEAHLLLSSTSEVHYKLVEALFLRTFNYKELKLISATIRPEILELYSGNEYSLNIKQYLKQSYAPHIQFTATCPPVTPDMRTLFFINSIDKILQMQAILIANFPTIRTVILSSEEEFPPEEAFENYDVIFATSVIKQGYSIQTPIDQVILYNIYHPVGAIDIVQYMARPRNQQPPMYVICATTHFNMENVPTPSLENLWNYLHRHATSDEAYHVNVAVEINKFLARSKFSHTAWNVLGVVNYFEEQMRFAELYDNTFETMQRSLLSMIPQARIVFQDIEEAEKIPFTKLDTFPHLAENETLQDLRAAIHEEIANTDNPRVFHKLKKLLKIRPIEDFILVDTQGKRHWYVFTNKIIVQQVLDPCCLQRCKQHLKNIESGAYAFRDKHDKRYLPQVGECYDVTKLGRKIHFMKQYFRTLQEPIMILKNLYSLNAFSYKGRLLKCTSYSEAYEVEILDNYTVEESWYTQVQPRNGLLFRLKASKELSLLR